ncbi:glutamate synthase subunit alpha [Romeria aff. gracilis LEGE 07310]|uniref:glutamate synthase (ferredoxin) n=1 Tax=Vasconcelosia minhoensis LEGE 07310 TaxID=915328 RepID=A0A8J7APE4_9CYAN|nr:glutamate synthase-related protein [Romeria gracilis]MBE9077821.1 glutamate synthase subunit alpha [Romeria aff. gracilis LEGE 07310]
MTFNQTPPVNHSLLSGPRWLVEERDACGVGFIADQRGRVSHNLVADALTALGCMEHRGGCCADQDSGDGAGVMTAIPWQLMQDWADEAGLEPLEPEQTGVGMVFLPQAEAATNVARQEMEKAVQVAGFTFLGWRAVPVKPETLGPQARQFQPQIEQVLVQSPNLSGDDLERQLYLIRRQFEQAIRKLSGSKALSPEVIGALQELYVCSFSSQTIVYKGMVRSEVLGQFYQDLQNPAYESPFAVYHRRFSTNTMPKWPLAHPMRLLGHNGEINTLIGNINWMMARQADLAHPLWGEQLSLLKPVVDAEDSDSANLDGAMELLVRSGRSPLESLMMMVPEAYQNQPDLADHPEITDFYEYYSGVQEPWDGPALIVFSDGKQVGATLDRNGLRPARYVITSDGYLIVSSEAGVVDMPVEKVIEKGRLGPGQMIAIDFKTQEILKNWEIKQRIAAAEPYGEWLQHRQEISPQLFGEDAYLESQALMTQQTAFGYTAEDLDMIIQDMAAQAKEPTFCMGNDTPLAILSEKPHQLYDYFKQRFAQVTNPPIDPLRERLVMSLTTQLGPRGNLLEATPEQARLLKLESPVVNEPELAMIRESAFEVSNLSTLYQVQGGPAGLTEAIQALCDRAAAAVAAGSEILILSDRLDDNGDPALLAAEYTYIPPLVAVGAVHHHLIRQELRMKASLVVDTAQCWSTHHFACLLGYGASAICPYLAFESVRHWWADSKTQKQMEMGKLPVSTLNGAQANYRKAVEMGLLKILSKMGISLLSSYQGAQIFEAIGIGLDLLELAFRGTVSRLGGLGIEELAHETMSFHQKAFPELTRKRLENMGFVQSRPSGEYHMNNPAMTKLLHKAVETRQYDHYAVYMEQLHNRPLSALRDLLEFDSDRESIDLAEVEPVEAIMERFCTGGMSLGSLSREAHETLAIAMNRIGGKSNSGEGGEDSVRFKVLDDVDAEGHSPTLPHLKGLRNGDTASSAIKQVASGRFGVTPEYLMNAKQIEIKMAQGAKPGEGGQLPGKKVSEYIAGLRRSKAGVTLISPPPHHDIYSIEDLAQLIFDLHQINPNAGVSVKLVAEIGIGTVAAGVAKSNADVILIAGHDGGTGASPLSSIKHAGVPWELGLSEVHRVLMQNQLRDRVRLRVDGGLKTGWDVIMGALMGGEEYGFGSISMIAEGCIMARICHTNNCPVGVATQKEELRQRFTGIPEHVVNFFSFVAQETRSLLAKLGYRSLSEIIGRADLLKPRTDLNLTKTQSLNLSCLIDLPNSQDDRAWLEHETVHNNGPVLDDEILANAEVAQAIAQQGSVAQTYPVVNTDRTVGARVAGAIAKKYGNGGFEGQLDLTFTGAAGQSFGAFNLPGMTLTLVGEANDYVGKGMHGGEIIIKPPAEVTYNPSENVILGNTCLYGATGGTLYALGIAGERFAVRNSKGQAVIEGAGDHCCEYMTGGVVAVLGGVGRNVGAGMTGGLAYFLDEAGDFPTRVNPEIVKVQRVTSEAGEQQLKRLISAHAERTGSQKAAEILDRWAEYLPKFWQVVPPSEADSPEAETVETAEMAGVGS